MSEPLKPCKHGKQPASEMIGDGGYWSIECACPRGGFSSPEYFEGVHADGQELAEKEWNNRPIEDALNAEIATLTSKLHLAEGRVTDYPKALAKARRAAFQEMLRQAQEFWLRPHHDAMGAALFRLLISIAEGENTTADTIYKSYAKMAEAK